MIDRLARQARRADRRKQIRAENRLWRLAEEYRRAGFQPRHYQPLPSERRRPLEADWLDGLERDRRGRPLPSMANALWTLREDWNLTGLIALEPKSQRAVLKACPPWGDPFRDFQVRGFTHRDVLELHAYLGKLLPGPRRSMTLQAVHIVAEENEWLAEEPDDEQA